jgi:hypothetical protein
VPGCFGSYTARPLCKPVRLSFSFDGIKKLKIPDTGFKKNKYLKRNFFLLKE